ncbi:MAG: hypothetical protein ABEL76_16105, partial [Bradymonadaceae bacterium]
MENGDRGMIVWNPKEMKIESTIKLDQLEKEVDGKPICQGFRRATVQRGKYVFKPFNWAGPDYYEYASTSKIAIIDTESDEVEKILEADCPGLGVGTRDEAGNIYFTNWVSTSAAPVIEGEEKSHSPCAVRIDAGEMEINEEWTRDLEEMTGGREVNAMRILDGSVAIAAVLDEERVDPGPKTDPKEITYANNWELWRLDLEEGTGSKVPNTGYIAGGFYAFEVDGKTIVTLPNADYSRTTAYEVPVEGPAKKRFSVEGWVYQLVEL